MHKNLSSPPPPRLGAHTSIAGGVHNAIRRGREIQAEVIQIFSKNQMQWSGRAYREKELEQFFRLRQETGVEPELIHVGYLINLASPEKDKHLKSMSAFLDEMRRAKQLQIPYLLTHPGSHMGAGEILGIKRIAQSLRYAWESEGDPGLTLLLELTAGQGSNLGHRFEHLRDIIDQSGVEVHLGVCLDTCHIFAAGYNICDVPSLSATLEVFDRIIGLSRLKAIHLNDSRFPLGSRRDRHERIGQGYIGDEGFRALVNHPAMAGLPMVLEIPAGGEADKQDLRLLRSFLNPTSPERRYDEQTSG